MALAVKVSKAIIATAAAVVLVAACNAPAQKAGPATSSAAKPGQWIELPFIVGKAATGIGITKAGDVYVGNIGRVYERSRAGYQMTETVPIEDLNRETGRVLLLENGAAQQKVALDGVDTMYGIAVGADGVIYTATRQSKIEQFQKGAATPTDLPFKLDEDAHPSSLTVDDAGRVYVIDNRFGATALRLDRGATEPAELKVFPFTGSQCVLAVTGGGDVYGPCAEVGYAELRILAMGANAPRMVGLADVKVPLAIGLHDGDVYVLDDAGSGLPQENYATESLRIVKFDKAAIDSTAAPDDEFKDPPKVTSSGVIPFTPGGKGAYHDMKLAANGDIYLIDGAKVFKITPA